MPDCVLSGSVLGCAQLWSFKIRQAILGSRNHELMLNTEEKRNEAPKFHELVSEGTRSIKKAPHGSCQINRSWSRGRQIDRFGDCLGIRVMEGIETVFLG